MGKYEGESQHLLNESLVKFLLFCKKQSFEKLFKRQNE